LKGLLAESEGKITSQASEIERLQKIVRQLQELLPGNSVKEGWLTKMSGKGKRWQKRYFVLRTNYLSYFKDNKNLKHPAGVIDLQQAGIAMLDPVVDSEIKSKLPTFKITSQGRTYYIQAKDEDECKEWLRATHDATALIQKTITNKTSAVF
jgi:hypothetical protein